MKCKYVDSVWPEYNDDKELLASISFGGHGAFYLKGKNAEEQEKIKQEAMKRYKERFGPDSGEIPFVEFSLFYAKK